MRHIVVSALVSLFALSSCGVAPPPGDAPAPAPAPQPGELVSHQRVAALSRAQIGAFIDQLRLPVDLTPANGVTFYRLVYRTADVDSRLTLASGTVVVPDSGAGPFPLLSDQHGTQVRRHEALTDPLTQSALVGSTLLLGARGWVLAGADYLGLGVNQGLHPYYHARTEGTASADFLRAVQAFTRAQGIPLSGQLFLSGYSQGAHVTMALHRQLDAAPLPGLTVVASAPMAGAYDLADLSLPAALQSPTPSSSLYVAYALLAYRRVYGFGPLESLFRAPWPARLPALFDGDRDVAEVVAALPPDPREMLHPDFVRAYLDDPQHPLRLLLRANDVLDWTPRAPVTLMHGRADRDVPYANAERAYAVLRGRGAAVQLVNLGDTLDHASASMPAYFAASAWFTQLLARR